MVVKRTFQVEGWVGRKEGRQDGKGKAVRAIDYKWAAPIEQIKSAARRIRSNSCLDSVHNM